MITLTAIVATFFAIQLVCWVVGLVFRMIGWTIKASFWLLGLLLSPVCLVLVAVLGLASAAVWILPLIIVIAFVSGLLDES